ncbi:MAG: CBS domain-containing protein [Halobacteria archaeon]|nr:CBS domain-containing protein [Halobacteria archaeon]
MIETYVNEIMNTDVETIGKNRTAVEASKKLYENNIGSLLVVEGGDVVGIITESDVVRLIAERKDVSDIEVSEFMSSPVISVSSSVKVEQAAKKMKENEIKKLAVVDDGELMGIITTTDMSNYLPRYHLESSSRGGRAD